MTDLVLELEKKQTMFNKLLAYSIIAILIFYNLFVLFINFYPLGFPFLLSQKLLLLFLGASCFMILLISKAKIEFYMLYKILSILLFFFIFYLSLLVQVATNTIYLLYIPLALLVLMYSNLKIAITVSVFFIILNIYTPDIAHYYNLSNVLLERSTRDKELIFPEYLIIFFSIYLSAIIVYFYVELKKINAVESAFRLKEQLLKNAQEEIYKTKEETPFDKLYFDIISELDVNKPYQNFNYSRKKLAERLNTNETYISKALSLKNIKNFNSLLNQYRVNQVKEALINSSFKDETIEDIYLRAGFNQQSTFNRVFKVFTGLTPSEYIENQNKS